MAEVLRYLAWVDPESPCGKAANAYVPPSQPVYLSNVEEPRSPSGPSATPTYVSPVVLKAPHDVLEKSTYALSEASTSAEDLVYERPTDPEASEGAPTEGARTPARVSSKLSRASSVVSFVGVDEDDDCDDDKSSNRVSWIGKEGNRARCRHRLQIVGAARRERWQKWKYSVGNAIGLKW
jgi:hypothetical protein